MAYSGSVMCGGVLNIAVTLASAEDGGEKTKATGRGQQVCLVLYKHTE